MNTLKSPGQLYWNVLSSRSWSSDAGQERVVSALDALFDTLMAVDKPSFKAQLMRTFKRRTLYPYVKGLYLWGGVGRGKTFLMDLLYDSLKNHQKVMRRHFHRFMHYVHAELTQLQGQKNPLDRVAEQLAGQARVICLDEFFVNDITDAMLLTGLLQALFARGVCVVTTSNQIPHQLYENGLQRERFIPAIRLLEEHTEVIHIQFGDDFRTRTLEQAGIYLTPLGAETESKMQAMFTRLVPTDSVQEHSKIEVLCRDIQTKALAEDVVWFEFQELCDGPRSVADYIELAKCFHAVLLSNVPVFTSFKEAQARRFIHLVDEFYDRNVKLILSAQTQLSALYQAQQLKFEFKRTVSRLQEMQSHEYLVRAHRT